MFSNKEQWHWLGYKGAVNTIIANTIFLQRYLNSYNELYVHPILSAFVLSWGQNFQKLLMLMSGFVPQRGLKKMPVPKFFKWILTWSPQIFTTPKLTPLCIFGRSGMVASHLWLYGTFARGTISTSDEMWGMRDVEPTQRLYRGHLHHQLCGGRDLIPTAASVPHEWLTNLLEGEISWSIHSE